VLTTARDRKLIDDSEFLRLLYKFTGENVDIEEMLRRGQAAPVPDIVEQDSNPAVSDGASDSSPREGGGKAGDGGTADPHKYPSAAKGDKSKGVKKV